MKSMHDLKGEYRAARKRYARKVRRDQCPYKTYPLEAFKYTRTADALVARAVGLKVTFQHLYELIGLADHVCRGGQLEVKRP